MKESFNFIGVENDPSDLNLEIGDVRAETGFKPNCMCDPASLTS